jgi:uncharacterized integral membrane protein (TIGR00697 family)
MLVICGLASSIVTASKVIHLGVNFPFSNLVFSILTYPIVDCICELWGKKVAQQTLWIALLAQLFIAILIQISINTPPASFWTLQNEYEVILSVSGKVIIASFFAFSISQLLDIHVYQKIRTLSKGKRLWLRSNISTYIGQSIDSIIFVSIVFHNSDQKISIMVGSIIVKIIVSFLMTPIVYLIIILINWYLESKTLAFEVEINTEYSRTNLSN